MSSDKPLRGSIGAIRNPESDAAKEKWQKVYYRGLLPEGTKGTDTHEIKLQLKPFAEK